MLRSRRRRVSGRDERSNLAWGVPPRDLLDPLLAALRERASEASWLRHRWKSSVSGGQRESGQQIWSRTSSETRLLRRHTHNPQSSTVELSQPAQARGRATRATLA